MICPSCNRDKAPSEFSKADMYGVRCKLCNRNRQSVRKHGLTAAQKQTIATHHGGCAICGHPDTSTRGWIVDHDHACCPGEKSCPKCRRGVICTWCNTVLGSAFDRVQILAAAIVYLERHARGLCDWHMPLACAPGICGTGDRASCTDGTDGTNEEPFATLRDESLVGERGRETRRGPLDWLAK